MKKINTIIFLFTIAAIYDGLLGINFLFFGNCAYQLCNITPPNHIGYVDQAKRIDAALLISSTDKKVKITGRDDGATGEELATYLLELINASGSSCGCSCSCQG